jgi:hypothetical protein
MQNLKAQTVSSTDRLTQLNTQSSQLNEHVAMKFLASALLVNLEDPWNRGYIPAGQATKMLDSISQASEVPIEDDRIESSLASVTNEDRVQLAQLLKILTESPISNNSIEYASSMLINRKLHTLQPLL